MIREVLQNLLMGIRPLSRLALRFHRGMGEETGPAEDIFRRFTVSAPVAGKRVLEIGPGKGWALGKLALQAGVSGYTGADVAPYLGSEGALACHLFDGRRLPFPDASFDLVWSVAAFEHFRHPREMILEIQRVLCPGGILFCDVDLRDHYHLAQEALWLDCLRHPEWQWRLMTWYRSGYVNRLRLPDWEAMFHQAAFEAVSLKPYESALLGQVISFEAVMRRA